MKKGETEERENRRTIDMELLNFNIDCLIDFTALDKIVHFPPARDQLSHAAAPRQSRIFRHSNRDGAEGGRRSDR